MKTVINNVLGDEIGFVRLVSFMQPAELVDSCDLCLGKGEVLAPNHNDGHEEEDQTLIPCPECGNLGMKDWNGDLEIVRNARTSYNADWRTGADEGKDQKLLDYMIRNRHSSPLEAMTFTFEVKAPIFVFRQWHRHRTWSYNEVSARYAEMEEQFYAPDPAKIGAQSKTNKQGRDIQFNEKGEFLSPVDGKPVPGFKPMGDYVPEGLPKAAYEAERNISLVESIMTMQKHCFSLYKGLLSEGVPRELARTVLPVSVYSRMFATVDAHNLFHFLSLRLDSHAQYEIRCYARALLDLITPVIPATVESWKNVWMKSDAQSTTT